MDHPSCFGRIGGLRLALALGAHTQRKLMSKRLLLWVLVTFTAAAHAKNYQVGSCLQGLPHFSTIQAAVNAVPPGSTVFVCPGTYPEQVSIGQPLTLRGIAFNNQDRPTITVPEGDPAI